MTMTTNRPVVNFDPAGIPDELKAAERWMLWKPVAEDNGTFGKAPVAAKRPWTTCSKTNDTNWSTFDECVKVLEKEGLQRNLGGLTFVAGGGFVIGDIDNVVDPTTREITDPKVARIVESLHTYSEYSPSGTGIRFACRGELPGPNIKSDLVELWGNLSGAGTFTGCRLPLAPKTVAEAGEALDRLYVEAGGKTVTVAATESTLTGFQGSDRPAVGSAGSVDDAEVIRAVDTINPKFRSLFDNADGANASDGDMSLANLLAYYCGPGGEAQVERIMRQSGRMRDKFNKPIKRGGPTYLRSTIEEAYREVRGSFDWDQWFNRSSKTKKKATEKATKEKDEPVVDPPEPAGGAATGAASFRHPSSLTDVGLGRRLALHAKGRLRFVEETQEWIGWNGKVWKRDRGLRAKHVAKQMSDRLWKEWAEHRFSGEDDVAKKRAKADAKRFVVHAASEKGIRAAANLAQNEPDVIVQADELDRHPMLLNVQNGVVDLESLELRKHDPALLITQMAGVAFDPKAECPRWRQFIEEVTAGEDSEGLAEYLQRIFGYCLTGDVSEHAFIVFHGLGRNGKSVALATMLELLGTYGGTAPSALLVSHGQRHREIEQLYGSLVGRRLVTLTENERSSSLNEAVLKQLVGGDKVIWRKLYCDAVETSPTWKIIAAMNHEPTLRGGDKAIDERLHKVPWTASFEGSKGDPKLTSKLRAELPGILNWCLVGLAGWRKQGGLNPPDCVVRATKEYIEAHDGIQAWLSERCIVRPGIVSLASELYRDYHAWCEDRGEHPMNATAFSREMTGRRGFKDERSTSGAFRNKTIRLGIGLVHDREDAP